MIWRLLSMIEPSEEGGVAKNVRLETDNDKNHKSYYKGEHPFDYDARFGENKQAIEISS